MSNLLNFLPEGSSRATVDLAEAEVAATAELGSGARKGVWAEDEPLWWWLPPAVVEEEEVPPP